MEYRKGPTIVRTRLSVAVAAFILVRTRLSVAVAAFILHAMQGPWPGAIGHTIKYLKAQGGIEIALQVLVLIPEEFTTITFTAQSKVSFIGVSIY